MATECINCRLENLIFQQQNCGDDYCDRVDTTFPRPNSFTWSRTGDSPENVKQLGTSVYVDVIISRMMIQREWSILILLQDHTGCGDQVKSETTACIFQWDCGHKYTSLAVILKWDHVELIWSVVLLTMLINWAEIDHTSTTMKSQTKINTCSTLQRNSDLFCYHTSRIF